MPREGWIRLRQVLGAGEIGRLHAAWDRLMVGPQDRISESNWGPANLAEDPTFDECLGHPRVLAAVRVLIGPEVRLLGCHGRCPPRGHGRQGLHTDWMAPVPPDQPLLANAFWVLDPVDGENGATRVVPGSHRWGRVPRGTVAQPHGRHHDERLLEADAGDVLVFSAHLWHAGSENRSGRRRRIAIAQYQNPCGDEKRLSVTQGDVGGPPGA